MGGGGGGKGDSPARRSSLSLSDATRRVTGMPVHFETISAMSDSVTTSWTSLEELVLPSPSASLAAAASSRAASASFSCLSSSRSVPYLSSAGDDLKMVWRR